MQGRDTTGQTVGDRRRIHRKVIAGKQQALVVQRAGGGDFCLPWYGLVGGAQHCRVGSSQAQSAQRERHVPV